MEAVFELPMRVVLDPDAPRRQRQHVRGVWREYWVWPHPDHFIWGATAAILVQLAQRLRGRGTAGGRGVMRAVGFAAMVALLCSGLSRGRRSRRPGSNSINTNFRWLGPDDKIVVERTTIRGCNVSCYMSRAETGGIKGGLGLAEDPSRFSIACRAVGPVTLPASMPRSEVIAFARRRCSSRRFRSIASLDPEKHVLVYTVVSTKLINGSPFNSISVVPTDVR